MKEKRRKTRKANRIAKEKDKKLSVNKLIGQGASKYCKKMSHKQMRQRLKKEEEIYTYRGSDYRLKQRLWDIT